MTLTIGKTVLQTTNTSMGIEGLATPIKGLPALIGVATEVDDTPEMGLLAEGDQHA